MPTIDDIRKALSQVQEPQLGKDIVTLDMVKHVDVKGGTVDLTVEMISKTFPQIEELKGRVEKAVTSLPGVKKLNLDLPVRMSPSPAQSRPKPVPVPGVKHVIAVYACKGGVGKTTVSTNLAVALKKQGAHVGILDADIHGPNIPLMMGIQDNPKGAPGNKLIPLESHGVQLMSLGFLTESNLPSIWRGPMVHGAVQQLLRDTLWKDLDYLVVDLPPGTGDAQLTIAQSAPLDGIVLVTTPQTVSLADGIRGLGMFQKLNIPILGMVENMSGFSCPECHHVTNIFSQGGGEAEAKSHNLPFLGRIPLDPSIVVGGDSGKPIVLSHPTSQAAKAFEQIANKLKIPLEQGPSS